MSSPLCRVCGNFLAAGVDPAFGICASCVGTLGVMPMPPARRPARPCTRCNGTSFIRVLPRELSSTGGDWGVERAAPMMLTFIPKVLRGRWLSIDAASVEPAQGRGVLETYVCRGCGFTEWYCLDPQSIPIGPEYMTEIIDYGPTTPYR